MQVRRVNTILYCSKWHETVAFYRDVLELDVALDRDWFVEFRIGEDSFVSVADADRASISTGHGTGITLSWRVDDLDADRSLLLRRGVDCTPVTERWGSDSTFFFDPEGHRIELWQRPD